MEQREKLNLMIPAIPVRRVGVFLVAAAANNRLFKKSLREEDICVHK
jgi:hypothetical protein